MTLLMWLSLLLCSAAGDHLTVEAKALKRNQLPDGFPLQVQDVGFAVIQVRLLNQSSQAWAFDPRTVRIFSPRKKRLKLASPEEITPKLMKLYSDTRRGVYGAVQVGRQPTLSEWERVPTVDPNRSPGTVSVDQGQRFRKLLEEFEIGEAILQPGESHQGLLYVKSKKTGARLYGGLLKLKDGTSVLLN
ncbi:MAG: hypothetical protein V3T83_03485 [Acidobacteriota bacterium]